MRERSNAVIKIQCHKAFRSPETWRQEGLRDGDMACRIRRLAKPVKSQGQPSILSESILKSRLGNSLSLESGPYHFRKILLASPDFSMPRNESSTAVFTAVSPFLMPKA